MAVWQFCFHIIPKNNVNKVKLDDILSWKNKLISIDSLKISFLTSKKSWSDNIIQYGELECDCIEISFNKKYIEEIECRLDMRKFSLEILKEMLSFANQIEAYIYLNGNIVDANVKSVIPLLKKSEAVKYCSNPLGFISSLN